MIIHTVRELMEVLSKLDPELQVMVGQNEHEQYYEHPWVHDDSPVQSVTQDGEAFYEKDYLDEAEYEIEQGWKTQEEVDEELAEIKSDLFQAVLLS